MVLFLILTVLPRAFASEEECEGSCEEQESWSLVILLLILVLCIFATYGLLARRWSFLPESVVVITIGVVAGYIIRFNSVTRNDIVGFDPDTFFLFLLPPIIFESGYSLHKGNFFSNLGSICVFAVVGTLISTVIVAAFTYILGVIGWSYPLPFADSLVFGALISAVDPVATLAVFHALNVNPTLNMLVFGESVLNDAVAIVLYHTVVEFLQPGVEMTSGTVIRAVGEFAKVSLGSVLIGITVALLSAIMFKWTNIRRYPSLELTLMFICAYFPYVFAEILHLSGIMAILFCGIVMAHYTYFNLSPTTQITSQHVFRMIAFVAETCIFGYLGLAVFTFTHDFHFGLVFWSIVLILIGRAANIFPLAWLANKKRTVKISYQYQIIMWFSGLRGAIAFALALKIPNENRLLLVTTTLVVVLFSIFCFGGGTLPMLNFFKVDADTVSLSKTEDLDSTVNLTAAASNAVEWQRLNWFERKDNLYFKPFLRRIHTAAGAEEAHVELQTFAKQWYGDLRASSNIPQHPEDFSGGHLAATGPSGEYGDSNNGSQGREDSHGREVESHSGDAADPMLGDR